MIDLTTLTNGCDPCEGSRILAARRCTACDLPIRPNESRCSWDDSPARFHEDCVLLFGASYCRDLAISHRKN